MKKLSIIMATVISAACLLCASVSAANEMTVSGAAVETTEGNEFAYTVSFSDNTGFNTLGVKLTYPEGFEYVSAEASELISDEFKLSFAGYEGETYVFYHDADNRTVTFVGAGLYDVDEANGDLFTLTFNAPESAGEYEFALELVDQAYDAAGEVVSVDEVAGTVVVIKKDGETVNYKLGNVTMDFDKDGKDIINYRDAIRVLQIAANVGATPTEAELYLANVTKDYDKETGAPIVNYRDAIKILQHAAGIITIE